MFFQQEAAEASASLLQMIGSGCFGALIGWFVYYINRYRKEDVQFSDLTTVLSILGGGAIMALFPAQSDLFGAYGIGLFLGFFGYFLILNGMVKRSTNFDVDWFLDGRRIAPKDNQVSPGVADTIRPMSADNSNDSNFG